LSISPHFQEERFKDREDIMKAKNSELEESLIRFSKYLQENDAKRARAFKKAADERRLCDEKSTEAEELVSFSSFTQVWCAIQSVCLTARLCRA